MDVAQLTKFANLVADLALAKLEYYNAPLGGAALNAKDDLDSAYEAIREFAELVTARNP